MNARARRATKEGFQEAEAACSRGLGLDEHMLALPPEQRSSFGSINFPPRLIVVKKVPICWVARLTRRRLGRRRVTTGALRERSGKLSLHGRLDSRMELRVPYLVRVLIW